MARNLKSYNEWLASKLRNPERAARYLDAASKESPEALRKALRKVAESRQMTELAEEVGVSRESLYRMMAQTGNPTHNNLDGILRALGFRLAIVPLKPEDSIVDPPAEQGTSATENKPEVAVRENIIEGPRRGI